MEDGPAGGRYGRTGVESVAVGEPRTVGGWRSARPDEAGLWRIRRPGDNEFLPVRLHETNEGILVTCSVQPPPALWLKDAAFDEYEWSGPVEIPPPGREEGDRWFCRSTEEWFVWNGHWWIAAEQAS